MVDGFESYAATANVTNGTDWSYVSEEGSITLLGGGGIDGKGVQVTNATLTLDVDESADYTNVWVRVYALATASESAPTVSDACAAFYIGADSNIYARNDATWSNLTSVAAVGGWMGFVVHLDYGSGEYDVYADTSGTYGAVMTKISDAPLTMENNSNKLYEIIVDCGKSTVVDGVGASRGYVAAGSSLATVDVIELSASEYALLAFNEMMYAAADDTLTADDRLSQEIKGGLRVNDEVRSVGNPWNTYRLLSSEEFSVILGDPLADTHYTPEASMWIYRGGGQLASLAFRTYDSLIADSPGTTVTDSTGETDGWNQCGWGGSGEGLNDGDNVGFQGVANSGDFLYLYRSGAWRRLWWNGSAWRSGMSDPGYTMIQGEGLWYLRRGTPGSDTWDPQ